MRRSLFALSVLAAAGCATLNRPDVEALKPALESFHQRIRWKDFRGAADLIVPERRTSFIKARSKANDDRDLYITNYELEDAKVEPGATQVTAITKLSWYRLPSSTEQTATLSSVFVWRTGQWLLESQEDGPFEDLAPEPKPKAAAPTP